MSDLVAVKKALPMFPHMLKEDLRLIRTKCQEKLAQIKGARNRATLEKAIAECDRLAPPKAANAN